MEFSEYLKKIYNLGKLDEREAFELFELLLEAEAELSPTAAQIGAYLFSTSLRAIKADEVIGAARSLRNHMRRFDTHDIGGLPPLLDTCGTGGSGMNPFNTSTAVALLCAASGQPVAKHGNRAQSSQSGSADVLRALGFPLTLDVDRAKLCLKETGFVFLFAPVHHPATARVAGIRKELKTATIFNFLGPLLNPAEVKHQLMGSSDSGIQSLLAEALLQLGAQKALVVRGDDGLDEVTLATTTQVIEVSSNKLTSYKISPEQFGIKRFEYKSFSGMEPEQSAQMIKRVFKGVVDADTYAYRELILLNAGVALFAADRVDDIGSGIQMAKETIDDGRAEDFLVRLTGFCQHID